MKLIKKPVAMTRAIGAERRDNKTIGFVPTLGALHEGHEQLIARARKQCDVVVVSSFVNRLQFRADAYKKYPRNPKADKAICAQHGVDYFFAPTNDDIYPANFDTSLQVVDLVDRLEGKNIRWHYRGVTIVVAKLFNIVLPDRAYFGKKDPHQLAILRRMTTDLNFAVKLVAVPTRRAKDGVALSSRNALLDRAEREAASRFAFLLRHAADEVKEGGGTLEYRKKNDTGTDR